MTPIKVNKRPKQRGVELILTIPGSVPSLKNGKEIAMKSNGQRFVRSNDKVLAWKRMATTLLRQQFHGYKVTGYPITVELTFWYGSKVRRDLDNSAAGVMDALRDAGVIEDDSVQFVNKLILHYGGLDKERPRVEIRLC